ncbi:MAG: SufS family cysteine desulfurase [Verrucomicrobiota bacterium]
MVSTYPFFLNSHSPTNFEVEAFRSQFPILERKVRGKQLAYLDNGATAQKPHCVIDAIRRYSLQENSNIHRGVHQLSVEATEKYEEARELVAQELGVASSEIIFTSGTTEAINLVAFGWARRHMQDGDEILLTEMDHHANLIPWQEIAQENGVRLQFIRVSEKGELDVESFEDQLSERTKLVGLPHVSNVLGTVNPVKELAARARRFGARVLIDGAQALPHGPVLLPELGADYYTFSGHKIFGPDGIGVLWVPEERQEDLRPLCFGGDMVEEVTLHTADYKKGPGRYEAGTPNISGVIGLGETFRFRKSVDWEGFERHEQKLLEKATDRLREIEGLRILGEAPGKAAIATFVLEGVHPHDLGTILDLDAVAVRAGHHCAQPLHQAFGVSSSTRASFSGYNTFGEIDRHGEGIEKAKRMLTG